MRATVETSVQIEPLTEAGIPALKSFLREHPEASVFHAPEWHRVIDETYGHHCDYWIAWLDREIAGVFPVVAVRHPLLGTKMIAMPYQFHSGLPLAVSEGIQLELVRCALARAKNLGARYLEIRHYEAVPFLEDLGFVSMDSQLVTTSTPLDGLDIKQVRSGHRRNVQYAIDHGVAIVPSENLAEWKLFWRLHLRDGRRMGSPQADWSFFQKLHQIARSRCWLLLAWSSHKCIGGLMLLDDGRNVFARYGASTSPEAVRMHVGKALLWQALSAAARRGCRTFNLGISWSRDRGLIKYKEGWSGSTRPVFQYVYPITSMPPASGSYFEGFQWAKAAWRRLPLWVVGRMGYHVTRWVC